MIRNLREISQFPKSRQEAACSLRRRQALLHTRILATRHTDSSVDAASWMSFHNSVANAGCAIRGVEEP